MSIFDYLFANIGKKKTSHKRQTGKRPHFEVLEQREMLSINGILSEAYTDTISTAGSTAAMYLDLKSSLGTNNWVTVGLQVDAASNSSLNPSKIEIKYQTSGSTSYTTLPSWAIFTQSDGEKSSSIIFTVPAGTYQVVIGGDNSTTGAFSVNVFVPGGTEASPDQVASNTSLLIQAGMHQNSTNWNPGLESVYKTLLGKSYSSDILAANSDWGISVNTGDSLLNARILDAAAASGKVTAKITKSEPAQALTISSASLTVTEKSTAFGTATAAITVSGGSSTSLKDYTTALSSTYTISGGSGADLSGVQLPSLVSGTDYKFEDGKFYFNPNGKFNFVPKGTSATLTLTYTVTDKTNTSLKGTGTITVVITGANDTPTTDKTEVDLTPSSTDNPVDLWAVAWTDESGETPVTCPDTFSLVIEGKEIKLGSKVVATITDPDIGDTFQFATIGFPAGTVVADGTNGWLLKTSGDTPKTVGRITLSSDGKTLIYKTEGNSTDSLFKSLENGTLSEKLAFTFTVKDNRGITTDVSGGDKKSESAAVSVSFQVKGKTDAEVDLSLTASGTSKVKLASDSGTAQTNIPLSTFFAVNHAAAEKTLTYEYVEWTAVGAGTLEIPSAVVQSLNDALILSGTDKGDGKIVFDRDQLSAAAIQFLEGLEEGESIDISFKIKVINVDLSTESVTSNTIHILFQKSTLLAVGESTIELDADATDWVQSGEPSLISGGLEQESKSLYGVVIDNDYEMTYEVGDGEAHEKPELVEGEDYKYEIFVANTETGQLGIRFSFKPNGKFDFLSEGQTATLTFSFLLKDTFNPEISKTGTFEVLITGKDAEPEPQEEELTVPGDPLLVNTYSSVSEMPDRITVSPTYEINGAAPSGYTFSAQSIVSATTQDGTYAEDASGLLIVNADGSIDVDRLKLASLHQQLGESDQDFRYYKITIAATKTGSSEPLTVEVPLTIRYVRPPSVETTTTIDGGEPLAANAPWEFGISQASTVDMQITVGDLNDYERASIDWFEFSQSITVSNWEWKIGDEATITKTQAESLAGTDAEMQTLVENVERLINAKESAFDYLFEQVGEDDSNVWLFQFEKFAEAEEYDFIESGNQLTLYAGITVIDKDFGGKTTIPMTIVFG